MLQRVKTMNFNALVASPLDRSRKKDRRSRARLRLHLSLL
jgi:hypothetical protein